MLTMLLGGLWHGAGWNFVIWGALHGGYLVIHRLLGRPGGDGDVPFAWRRDLPRAFLTFHAVCLGWIFFRAQSAADAWTIVAQLATGPYPSAAWPVLQCGVIAVCAALHPLERLVRERRAGLQAALAGPAGRILEGLVIGVVLALVLLLGGTGGEFIYSQF